MSDSSGIPVFTSVREVHTVCLPIFSDPLSNSVAAAFWVTYLVVPSGRKYNVIRLSGLGIASTVVSGVTLQSARASIRKHAPAPWQEVSTGS